jgi:hypothetical protein
MKTHWLAKVAGWAFFALNLVTQVAGQAPHGWQGWLQSIGSGIVAVGVHAASSTDGKQ